MSEAELKEYQLQLESVEAALKSDPDNTELQSLVSELHEIIALTKTVLAETTGPKPKPSSSSPPTTNNSRASIPPISTSSTPVPSTHSPYSPYPPTTSTPDFAPEHQSSIPSYAVGDQVHAKWTSGDNAFYPAKITSVLGSTKNPIYLVKFTQYNATEQLAPKDIRPLSKSGVKRKLDVVGGGGGGGGNTGAGGLSTAGLPVGAVISQPAAINAELAEKRKKLVPSEEGKEEQARKKGRRLEQKKVLEEGKKKWQEFAAKGTKKGKKRVIGENSMFRTPDSVTGRVGFTGSGQAMRKDAVRGKHIYQRADEDE
ncbi:hypothetical protein EX30DRAFT_322731 [Ascodesmis nigricans]|uniref:Tudor domain-containing protein n=1 Tax=Ascodesmis nigricans TaxID=341454 RepID=A0A4S2MS21_9PEZI|nr:hypothetical protein EX30DRAFT_322731 [Ascodesmis nigricans]